MSQHPNILDFHITGADNESLDSYSMTASKENVTIEEDMDTSEVNDSKQWNITDQQVKLKDSTAIRVCVCVCLE